MTTTPDPVGARSSAPIQGSAAPVDLEGDTTLRCHCWFRGERCTNQATAEDLLCNWCTTGYRDEKVLRADPRALIGPNDEYMGIGGGMGQPHQSADPTPPSACWCPDSGRTVA